LAALAGGGCAFFDVLEPAILRQVSHNAVRQYVVWYFRSICKNKKEDMIAYWEKLDGVCVFISDHTENTDHSFSFSPEKIIPAYREKTKIGDAFKQINSFLIIRPFFVKFVKTDTHVRAVYNISVLAYFIDKDLAERREKIENIDYLNSKNL